MGAQEGGARSDWTIFEQEGGSCEGNIASTQSPGGVPSSSALGKRDCQDLQPGLRFSEESRELSLKGVNTTSSAVCLHRKRHDVATVSRRPCGRLGPGQALGALLCACALPCLAGVQWDRAMPFEGRAQGSWPLTITGSFSSAATYKCQFTPIETVGLPIESDPVAPADATRVICSTPEWTLAAQRTTLRLLDVSTSSPVVGPGGTAAIITYTASWYSRGTEEGTALGGDSMSIDGFGFDTSASDYVCKFVSNTDSTRVAQSVVPVKPTGAKTLRCLTPRWPFNARGAVGATTLYLEKGGLPLEYTGTTQDQRFTYQDVWEYISHSRALSTYASETLVVSGAGFEVGSVEYSCQFTTTENPVYQLGVAGRVVSSFAIECITPHWRRKEALTHVTLYKQNCNGARGVASSCGAANLVTNDNIFRELTFVQAARNMSLNSAPASRAGSTIFTIFGGGFDAQRKDYAVQWRVGNDSVRINVNGTRTAYHLELELPQWAFAPNQIAQVTIFAGRSAIANSFDSTMTFMWESSWSTYIDEAPIKVGTSAGGELITVVGQGFVVNASQSAKNYIHGVGIDNDYACKFTDDKGFYLLSERVEPVSRTQIVCTTPAWGLVKVAVKTTVTLMKGSYEYPGQSDQFTFLSSWQTLSATSGPIGGGVLLTINGVGFNASKTFQCKFSYNNDELFAYTDPILPVSANQVVFKTPRWLSWQEGRTQLIIFEGGVQVLQIVDGGGALAAYEFLPGFIVSQPHLDIKNNEVGSFSFYPDTSPTGTVTVKVISNDTTIASVSSPYTMTETAGTEGNTKLVSVRCLHPGVASIALSSSGANYGEVFLNQVLAICKATIEVDKNSASMTRGGTLQLHLDLDPRAFSGNISISISSSNIQVFTAHPSLLIFQNYTTRTVQLFCTGVGSADLLFGVVSDGGNFLYTGVTRKFAVYGMPGFIFPVTSVALFPGTSTEIEFAPDTPPSLKVDFLTEVSDASVSSAEDEIYFPAMRTASKKFRVFHVGPGTTTVNVIGRSAGMQQQISIGCSAPDAIRCTEKFVGFGCDFKGSNLTGGDSTWNSTMNNVSSASGVKDCRPYRGCFRSSCCNSPLGAQCTAAFMSMNCDVLKMVPPLSETEDKSYDFGAVPVDKEKTDLLYRTWVNGIDCQPYVPCAWSQCFPGAGNYESVTSQRVTILAYPGFVIAPLPVNLHQGRPMQLTITLQAQPSGPVRVRIHTVDSERIPLMDPSVHVFPKDLVFSQGSIAQNVTVQWLGPGRTSFLLVADQNSHEFANVSHFFQDIISSSPGFLFRQLDPRSDKGGLSIRNGVPNLYIKKAQEFEITLKLDFLHSTSIALQAVQVPPVSLPLQIAPSSMNFIANIAVVKRLSVTSQTSGETVLRLTGEGSSVNSARLHILNSGVGYTSGSIGLRGYGGTGFVASFGVGVSSWGFYVDLEHGAPRTGTNYTYQGQTTFQLNQSSTSKVSIGSCFRAAVPLLFADDAQKVTGHTGDLVLGCVPNINVSIAAGKVFDLIIDSSACLATGITCQISLEAYGGAGFHGFFQTGITITSIISSGSGYLCDWACFAVISSESGLVAVPGQGKLGHRQSCPADNPTCSDGFLASAQVIYGDVTRVQADIRVFAFAAANITADVSVLRQTQKAIITVTPLELPTGNVTFSVSASTDLLQVTDFQFTTGAASLKDAAQSFTVIHLGGGSSRAKVSIFGVGTGNFDGFTGSIEIDVLPGFYTSVDSVKLQLFPGYFIVRFGPDSPPTKNTIVRVHVSTDFGNDILLDSYGEKLINVPDTLVMPAGSTSLQDLKIMHGGFGIVKLRNRVSGTATVTFSVSDIDSNYDGIGIDGSTKSIIVDVKPGFESNIQDTFMRYLQSGALFPLTITLDQATTQAINISARSLNTTIAKVTPQVTILAGHIGPVHFDVAHQGLLGETYISLNVETSGGNYDGVTGVNYMKVVAVPGLLVSTNFIHLQYVKRVETVEVGLDMKPDADVDITFSSSDPHIVGVTSFVNFKAEEWTPSTRRTLSVMWHGVGDVYLQCVCRSPGGIYNQVYRLDLVKVRSYRPLQVSRTKVRVQKYGRGEFSVSTALKPNQNTLFTVMSSPAGIVDVGGPFLISPGTNDSFVVNITHVKMGAATVRVFASAPGDIYDGAAADIQVSAMPGFTFSEREILLHSCPRTAKCVRTFTFAPDIAPSADVFVTITSSDTTIATVQPSLIKLPAGNGTQSTLPITVSYISPGSVCLSFAATSVGNFDLVSAGGVTVIALPDFIVGDLLITPRNGGQSHGIDDFVASHPIIYVQNGSFSTFSVRPTVVPIRDSVIYIQNPRPDIIEVTASVIFKDGDISSQIVTVTHKAFGNVRLSLLGNGGVYDRAAWEDGILVKALPSIILSKEQASIRYRYAFDFIVQPSEALVDSTGALGQVRLNVSVEDIGSLTLNTPSAILLGGENKTLTVTHSAVFVDPANPFDGTTRLSIKAYGPDTNYHHAEGIIALNLDFPGFSVSTSVIHVQRWQGSALQGNATNTLPGTAQVFLTPDESPDSITTINFQSNSPRQSGCSVLSSFCPVESEEFVTAPNPDVLQRNKLVWSPYAFEGRSPKFIQATHEGVVIKTQIEPQAPSASAWPMGAFYIDSENNRVDCQGVTDCPGSLRAVYSGLVAYIPNLFIYNHAGFQAPISEIFVQRQSQGKFELKLDTIPMANTIVYFTSSDPSIVTVQESAYYFKGEDFFQNITVFAVSPGLAYISVRSESDEFDYDGAEAIQAIKVNAMKGIGLSRLLIYLQAPPTESGQTSFSIFPDTRLNYPLTVGIASSNTALVTCTPSVTFPVGEVIPQNVTLNHIASGTQDPAVSLTFTISTAAGSEYSKVKILPSKVVPLGTFVLSQTTVRVQKARTLQMTVAPNVPPDEDVEVFLTVGDTSIVTATVSVKFMAKKMDPVPFTLHHVNAGHTKLSFKAVSTSGNYYGSYLTDVVAVEALHGFQAWSRVIGVTEALPHSLMTPQDLIIVQSQPTSHLSFSHFLVTIDIIPDQETVVVVKSSAHDIVTTSSNVTFEAGLKSWKPVTVVHGGRSGIANIYFSATTAVPAGNCNGLESGDVKVKAAPGFVFSRSSLNVQQDQITNITVRPDLEPTEDVILTIVSSDPSVVNVTERLVFTAVGGVGPKNTKTVSIGYMGIGTAALSFFATGGIFEGVIYSNAVVAAARPGFIISEKDIVIPYDGSYRVTFQADTVPTDDAVVSVASSQPAKAAPTVTTFFLRAGAREVFELNIKSWCSVSPGNCARAGKAVISFSVSSPSGSGNYNGVETITAITVTVSAPVLTLSTKYLYVQQRPGFATFTVAPIIPLNRDTTVSFEPLDPTICSSTNAVLLLKNASNKENTIQVTVNHISVGETYVKVFVKHPLNSNYVNIDPLFVYIRTLATLSITPNVIKLQPLTSISVRVVPGIEIDADLSIALGFTDKSTITVSPTTLTFKPPRNLIGLSVNVAVGIRVVLAELFQVFPRLGVGTIVKVLNDNLDLVAVNWDIGITDREYAVGNGGKYMLAQYEDLSQTITINHVAFGDASVYFKGHSSDVNYNGLDFQDAAVVHATPSFLCSSSDMVLQYQGSATVEILPRIPPSTDISVQIRVVTEGEQKAETVRSPSDIVQVTPQNFEMYRVDGTRPQNRRSLILYCAKTGSVQIEFKGAGGNYDDVLYHPIKVRCLPGLLVQPAVTPILSSPHGLSVISIRPNVVPNEQVTVVVTASKPNVIRHTRRLYFEPFVEDQSADLVVHHNGGYFDDDCRLSLQGYGGNFDGVDIPELLHVRISRPDLVVPVRAISVQPNSYTTFPVHLDTSPSAGTYITATSSDTSRATINGPLLVYDTSEQIFTVTHIAPGSTTITFSLQALIPGSTYANVSLPSSLTVVVTALGSGFLVSSSQVDVLQGTPSTITIGPDAIPDSRVELKVETQPADIVSVLPPLVHFEQGTPGQYKTFQLTWLRAGDAVINLKSMGGNFQSITRQNFVRVNALPTLPAMPLMVQSRQLVDKKLEISFSPPATEPELVTAYLVEISETSSFSNVILATEVGSGSRKQVFGPLIIGVCYFYRVTARNRAGLGVQGNGPSCKGVFDSPSAVREVQVKTISEEAVLLQWLPPMDSGDGTPNGMPILSYSVQVRLENGDLQEQISSPADRRSAVLRITPGISYTVNINTVTSVSQAQPHSAGLLVSYSGTPLIYDVPLEFTISSTSIVAPVGASTSVSIKPASPPYLDVIVHVASSNEQSGTSTLLLVFKKGSIAPQYVIISHKRKGVTILSFKPTGRYFRGLDTTVTVETLASEL